MQEVNPALLGDDDGEPERVVVEDVRVQLEGFYRDVLWALSGHMHRGGTAQGAPVVVKRVALEWGLDVGRFPLPRLSRSEFARLKEDSPWNG